jgi:hypothetical protein
MGYETAKYQVVETIGDQIEIREYDSLLLATVSSPQEGKRNNHFRTLFKYISGKNSQEQEIPMTTPVFRENQGGMYKMSFVMPANFKKQNLPTPNNSDVRIEPLAHAKFIAIRFSGRSTDKNFKKEQYILEKVAQENNIPIDTKHPVYAYYNSPWTLPWWKRNEVLFKVIR